MKIRSYLLTFCLLLVFAIESYAQPPSQATPTNYTQVSQFITDNLGTNSGQTTSQLNTYLSGILTGTSDSCGIPAPDIYEIAPSGVTFEWADVPGASMYRIYYLNLQTGTSGYQNFPPSPTNKYKLPGVTNDTYLFSVQAACGLSRSYFGIIIAETDLMSTYWPDLTCSCEEYEGSAIGIINGYQLPTNSEIELRVILDEPEDNINIHVKTGGTGEVLQFNPDCGGLEYSFGIGWTTSDVTGSVYFLTGTVNYYLSNDATMEMITCGKRPRKDLSWTTPTVFPNPMLDRFTLQMEASTEILQIHLLDLHGKQIAAWQEQTFEGFFEKEYDLPTGLASGIYILRVQDGASLSTIRLQKF